MRERESVWALDYSIAPHVHLDGASWVHKGIICRHICSMPFPIYSIKRKKGDIEMPPTQKFRIYNNIWLKQILWIRKNPYSIQSHNNLYCQHWIGCHKQIAWSCFLGQYFVCNVLMCRSMVIIITKIFLLFRSAIKNNGQNGFMCALHLYRAEIQSFSSVPMTCYNL